MAITVIKGRKDVGKMASKSYEDRQNPMYEMVKVIEASNSQDFQDMDILNRFLGTLENEVPRIEGTPVPVERFNVLFVPGGLQADSAEFNEYVGKFEMSRSKGYNATSYDFSIEDEYEARNRGVDLNADALKRTSRVSRAYMTRYLPYARLLALITGHSGNTTVPTDGSGQAYERATGWLRGEDCQDFLPPTEALRGFNRNHFRVKVGANLSENDIYNMTDSIMSFNNYSGKGIVVLGHPRTIQNLGGLYSYNNNQDKMLIDGVMVKDFLGCSWLECQAMHTEFLLFLDKGKMDVITRCVEKDPEFRGMGILTDKESIDDITSIGQIGGATLRIFPEEFVVFDREAGGLLDIGASRSDASGEMQTDSITVLENFAKALKGGYDLEALV